ncbi:MAG: hypothetical protein HQM08_24240 [Candidatus Riflebacteria bacterium]|nr:hypothetical protein [Candidatus Riflebacteria bacterium]
MKLINFAFSFEKMGCHRIAIMRIRLVFPALCLFVFFFSFSMAGYSSDPTFENGLAIRTIGQFQQWPGFLKDLGVVSSTNSQTFQNLCRIWTKANFDSFKFKAEIETNSLYNSNGQFENKAGSWNSIFATNHFVNWDLQKSIYMNRYADFSATLERFDFSWTANKLDFDLGRQPISLGTSHFIGILDVLAPFCPGYLDASYKPGVDALRIRTGAGTSGEAELIFAANKQASYDASIGRIRNTFSGIDLELLGGRFRERNFTGLAWAGEKRKVDLWGEMAFFQRKLDKEKNWGGDSRFALSWIAGMEKEVYRKMRMGIAFMYQDFGFRKPEDFQLVTQDSPFKEDWTFLSASEYGLLTLHMPFTQLMTADLSGIFNLIDHSTLWQPKLSISTTGNSDVSIFCWLRTGRESNLTSSSLIPGSIPLTQSEFGLIPQGIGVIFRRFF